MSNETKQTAVDLLWSMIPESTQKYIEHQLNGYEKAKEMEKEQMIDFAHKCSVSYRYEIERKYNETYGGNKIQCQCQFEMDTSTSSATKCKFCGKEKWQHVTHIIGRI